MAATYTVMLSPEAADDLTMLAAKLMAASPMNGPAFLARIRAAIEELQRMPLRHPAAREHDSGEEGAEGLRQCICGNYRIIFTVDGMTVYVHTVRHAARDNWKPG